MKFSVFNRTLLSSLALSSTFFCQPLSAQQCNQYANSSNYTQEGSNTTVSGGGPYNIYNASTLTASGTIAAYNGVSIATSTPLDNPSVTLGNITLTGSIGDGTCDVGTITLSTDVTLGYPPSPPNLALYASESIALSGNNILFLNGGGTVSAPLINGPGLINFDDGGTNTVSGALQDLTIEVNPNLATTLTFTATSSGTNTIVGTTIEVQNNGYPFQMIFDGPVSIDATSALFSTNNIDDIIVVSSPLQFNSTTIGSVGNVFASIHIGANTTMNNPSLYTKSLVFTSQSILTFDSIQASNVFNIDATVNNIGTIDMNNTGAFSFPGTIGANFSLFSINLNTAQATTFQNTVKAANIYLNTTGAMLALEGNTTGNVIFASTAGDTSSTVYLSDTVTITGNIDNTVAAGVGNLIFLGGSAGNTVTGSIGQSFALYQINAEGGAGKTVTLPGPVSAETILMTGTGGTLVVGSTTASTGIFFTEAATLKIISGSTITGNIINNTGSSNTGTLTFAGSGSVSGTVGVGDSGALSTINLIGTSGVATLSNTIDANTINVGGTGNTLNLNGNVTTGTINFNDSSNTAQVNIGPGITFAAGSVTTNTNDTGILNFASGGSFSGTVGSNVDALYSINLTGTSAVLTLSGAVFAETLNITGASAVLNLGAATTGNVSFSGSANAASTVTLADAVVLTGNVSTATAGIGALTFLGGNGSTVTGTIGGTGKPLAAVNISGSGDTIALSGTVYTDAINLTATNTTLNLSGSNINTPVINIENTGDIVNLASSISTNVVFLDSADSTSILNINDMVILTGNVSSTTTTAGTLNFLGGSSGNTVTGTIGGTNFPLFAINAKGAASTVTLPGPIDATTITLSGTGGTLAVGSTITSSGIIFTKAATLEIISGSTITGNIINNTGSSGTGTLTFLGAGSVSGTIGIGDSGALSTINLIGTLGGISGIVTLSSAINANTININGAGNTLNLNGNITTKTINFNDSSNAAQINFGPGITIAAGSVTTSTNDTGILNFASGGTFSGAIGSNVDALYSINLTGTSTILNLMGTVYVQTLNITGASATLNLGANTTGNVSFSGNANAASTVTLADMAVLAGNVSTATAGTGTLTFLGGHGSNVTGSIGGAGKPLAAVDISGPGDTISLSGFVYTDSINLTAAGTILNLSNIGIHTPVINIENTGAILNLATSISTNIDFSGLADNTSTINLSDAAIITGNVDSTTTANVGILNFLGGSVGTTVTGSIGATHALYEVNLQGPNKTVTLAQTVRAETINLNASGGTLNLQNDITATSLNFAAANTTVNLANNVVIETVDNTSGTINVGTLNVLGNASFSSPIGPTNPLFAVNITGSAGNVVNFSGNVAALTTTVNNGATLNIENSLTLDGGLSIANGSILSLGTNIDLNIVNTVSGGTGALNLGAGGILKVDMGGNLTSTGLVTTQGATHINPSASVTIVNAATSFPSTGATVPLIESNGGGAGLVAIPVNNNRLLINLSTQVVGNVLELVLSGAPISKFAVEANISGVAQALDFLYLNNIPTNGSLQAILNQLEQFYDLDSLLYDLSTLAPVVDGAVLHQGFNNVWQFYDSINERLTVMRSGNATRYGYRNVYSGIGAGDGEAGQGLWGQVFGQSMHQDQIKLVPGYGGGTLGIAVGGDTLFSDTALIGGAFSYANTHIDNTISPSSETRIQNYQGTIYGQFGSNTPLFLNWMASLSVNDYIADRRIIFGAVLLNAHGHYTGIQYGAQAECGYDFARVGFHTIPLVSLFYSHLGLDKYTETSAGTADQTVNASDFDMLLGGIGAMFLYDFEFLTTLFEPEFHLRLFYDFINDRMATTSQFTGGGPSFTTSGFNPPAVSYNIGASATVTQIGGFVYTVSYDFDVQKHYTANAGYLRVRYEW